MSRNEMVHPPGNSHPSGKSGGNGTRDTVKKPKTNWKKVAQEHAEELTKLRELHFQALMQIQEAEGKSPLPQREAVKLRKLEHIAARIINAPLCEQCKDWVDQMYQSEIRHVEETDGPQDAVGG